MINKQESVGHKGYGIIGNNLNVQHGEWNANVDKRLRAVEDKLKVRLILCVFCAAVCTAFLIYVLLVKFNSPQEQALSASSLIIAFVGVLATFIVIKNESQVREVKNEFERKVVEVEKASRKYTKDRIADYELSMDAVAYHIVGMLEESKSNREAALDLYMIALERISKATDKTPLHGIMSYAIGLIKENRRILRVSEEDKQRYRSIVRKIDHCDVLQLEELIKDIGCPRPSE